MEQSWLSGTPTILILFLLDRDSKSSHLCCITDYINFCMENTVPTGKIQCFSNTKPWVIPEPKAMLNEKKRFFKSGDKEELRRMQKKLKRGIRRGKDSYRRKHLKGSNAREVWRGLKTISGLTKDSGRGPESGDLDWANELNLFFLLLQCFQHNPAITARGKLEGAGVACHLAAWTTDYLTNRPQHVRLHDCVSDVVICGTGAPQGTVLSLFLFKLYTSDFSYNMDSCHLQKFSNDTTIVAHVTEGNNQPTLSPGVN